MIVVSNTITGIIREPEFIDIHLKEEGE